MSEGGKLSLHVGGQNAAGPLTYPPSRASVLRLKHCLGGGNSPMSLFFTGVTCLLGMGVDKERERRQENSHNGMDAPENDD